MALSGPQIDRIAEAIRQAYMRDELRRVVKVCLDEDLNALVPDKAYAAQAFDLVTWADRQGRALDLVRCAWEHNRGNAGLKALWAEVQGWGIAETAAPPPADSPPQLFLSYSRKDTAIMRRLHAGLLAAGLTVWTDEGLEPGTPQWQDAIEAAIDSTRGMVVVLSPHAKSSEWVKIEVSFAQELGRRVFPVLVHGDKRTAVLLSLYNVQFVDARTEWDDIAARLIPALRKHLGVGAPPPTPAPPPVAPEASTPKSGGGAAAPKPQTEAAIPGTAPSVKPEPQAPPTTLPGTGPTETVKSPPTVAAPLAIEWITVPAGEFLMGSDKKQDKPASDNETPQHKVHLPEYQIAKYPITNAQYQEFVRAAGHSAPSHWDNGQMPKGKEQHPVVNVSWHDAVAFCAWATTALGREIRLPTEAEWEKVARGTDGRIWPWGNEPPMKEHCNFGGNVGDTTPVGKYSPRGDSPYGVCDMAGNVWEWTRSLYQPYPYKPDDGRENPEGGEARTLRGGSWYSNEYGVRCAIRDFDDPDCGRGDGGFRCASPGFRS